MNFRRAEPDENFLSLHFLSEEGKWEVGLRPMAYGVRVSIAKVGAIGPCVEYCAGARFTDQVTILAAVLAILENISEERTERDLRRFFPYQTVKPMYNDPECWAAILALAGEEFAATNPILSSEKENIC